MIASRVINSQMLLIVLAFRATRKGSNERSRTIGPASGYLLTEIKVLNYYK
jgi:hypothetical protein